jgi:hypothetical protein
MEGRHVGLDFYDLLIEVLYRMRPVGMVKLPTSRLLSRNNFRFARAQCRAAPL